MNYLEALDYLNTYQARGIVPGVDHLHAFLRELGDPQKSFPSIIVGGTNGKGSTAMALSGVLINSGLRVGTYTSPHLHTFRERIKVDLEDVDPETFARLTLKLKTAMEGFTGDLPDGRMTYFEIGTILAFEVFRDAKVDAAVLEVGMGGRLDATNVSEPALSLITNIGADHAEFLGENVMQRAMEKFGIVHPGGVLVTAEKPGPVREYFRAEAKKINAQARFLGEEFSVEGLMFKGDGERFNYRGPGLVLDDVETKLIGPHQVTNMALVLAGAEALIEKGWNLPEAAIRRGIADVSWPGRLELFKVGGKAPILLDGAHNPDAAEVLVYALLSRFKYRKLFAVIGLLATKQYKDYFKALAPALDGAELIVTRSNQPNPREPEDLAEALSRAADPASVTITHSIAEALETARDRAEPDDLILVTGSLYTVLEAREFLGLAQRGTSE